MNIPDLQESNNTTGISKESPISLPEWDNENETSTIAYTAYDKEKSN